MIPEDLRHALSQHFGSVDIGPERPLGGGDICSAATFEMDGANRVIKWGEANSHAALLEAEMTGLDALEASGARVPGGRQLLKGSAHSAIVMDYVDTASPTRVHWESLAHTLASLHGQSQIWFGWEHPNYIGTIKQSNTPNPDLQEFLVAHRFEPLMEMAAPHLDATTLASIRQVLHQADRILPPELPALIHGDLWSGNVLFGADGEAWLIDPSAHYGCREQDLAMLDLFGKLNVHFLETYERMMPLHAGWQDRLAFWKMIPLLVHVVLFGQRYESALRTEMAKLKPLIEKN